MAMIRCPQCGTEFEKGSVEFCPNPNCGYPVAFLDEEKVPEEPPRMERRPGEVAPPPVPPPLQPPPPAPKKPRNLRPLLFIGGAVAVIAIIVVAFLLLTGGDKGKTKTQKTTAVTPSKKPSKKPSESPSPVKPTKPPKGIQLTWHPANDQEGLVSGQSINAMAGSPKGGTLVAAGSAIALGESDAAVWHSTDGLTWTITTAQTGQTDLGGPGDQQMNGIGPRPGGGFIVVGSDTSSGSEDAAVWLSPDSNNWTKVVIQDAGKQSMNRVAPTGTNLGLLAVGSTTNTPDGSQDGAIWTSQDGGNHWTLLPSDQFGGAGDQEIKRVTVLKSGLTTGFVAVGTSTLNGDSDAAVWTSADGQTWTRVQEASGQEVLGGPGNQGMTDVQTLGSELVAGGFAESKDGLDAAIWTSTNGTQWTRVDSAPLGGEGDQVIERILVTKPVEGSDVPAVVAAGTSTVGGNQDAAIWYSTDGTTWNRELSTADALGGDNAQAINTIGQQAGTLVAVGSDASGGSEHAQVWDAETPPSAAP